jgi:hypothetical protein
MYIKILIIFSNKYLLFAIKVIENNIHVPINKINILSISSH